MWQSPPVQIKSPGLRYKISEKIHKIVENRLKIPMENNKRSLNLSSSVAIILAECLKQTKWI